MHVLYMHMHYMCIYILNYYVCRFKALAAYNWTKATSYLHINMRTRMILAVNFHASFQSNPDHIILVKFKNIQLAPEALLQL